ncbi:4-hydroxy-tetrahydrodipicolinate reductase [bacterium]|nr:4-hydroxy-tetrahydrodipicolinate reductase [candidate division CSSED10-310 bacterium]
MGKHVISAVQAQPDMKLAGAVESADHPAIGRDAGEFHGLKPAGVLIGRYPETGESDGVVIDFSLPGGPEAAASWAQTNRWNFISGTTALSGSDQEAIRKAAGHVAVLTSSNFSLGIQLLLMFAFQAAKILPEEFDVTVIESHHKAKRDRPSGTAKSILQAVALNSPSARWTDVAALRAGNIIGEHELRLVSDYETISVSHHALTRDVFARGAVKCARWIHGRPCGLYEMKDMIER